MIKKKGLALRVFIYTFTLITLVTTISFGVLYFVLPGYYLRQKSKTLKENADRLELALNNAETQEQCAELILESAEKNNSEIISFGKKGEFIPELSSPFLLMDNAHFVTVGISYEEDVSVNAASDGRSLLIRGSKPPQDMDILINEAEEPSLKSNRSVFLKRELSGNVIEKLLNNDMIGSLTISSTLQPIDEAKSVLLSLAPYLFGLNLAISLAAAFIFAKQLVKPILKISDAAAMMHEMTPGVLSGVRTEDELGQLSLNLDNLYLNLCENIQNLHSEMDKVARLEQLKTDFMRAAGHELKTPISSLNCIIEGMLDNVGPYKNHEKYLSESRNQVSKLSSLVNEILTASRLEHMENSLTPEEINIADIVAEAVGMYEILITEKQKQITTEPFNFQYTTDPHVLMETMSNLISNAVNYTVPGGKILISFDSHEKVLSLENECEPIDAELMPKLFEPFFTLNYSRDKKESGTGLGLYIVKKNLEALELPFSMKNTETGIKFSIYFGRN